MNEIELKIQELKSLVGKEDKESRERFSELLSFFENNDSLEVQEELSSLLNDGIKQISKEVDNLKKQIGDVYELLPLSYIAKNYFNRSRAWLYQRLHGHNVNGHVYTLTEHEKSIFNRATREISIKIGSAQL